MQLRCISIVLMWTLSSVIYAQAQIATTANKPFVDLSAYSVSLSDDVMTLAIGNHQGR